MILSVFSVQITVIRVARVDKENRYNFFINICVMLLFLTFGVLSTLDTKSIVSDFLLTLAKKSVNFF